MDTRTFAPSQDVWPKYGQFCPKICFLGHIQSLPAYLVPFWLVGWWLLHAGCFTQDTYLLWGSNGNSGFKEVLFGNRFSVDSHQSDFSSFCGGLISFLRWVKMIKYEKPKFQVKRTTLRHISGFDIFSKSP